MEVRIEKNRPRLTRWFLYFSVISNEHRHIMTLKNDSMLHTAKSREGICFISNSSHEGHDTNARSVLCSHATSTEHDLLVLSILILATEHISREL